MIKKLFVAAALAACLTPMLAQAASDTDRVKSLVKQKMNIEATSVKRLPIGLYEVVANRSLLYVDKDVKFLVAGHIFDIVTQKNLTQERLDELSRIDIAALPLEQAIKTTHGKGERTLYLFADPYCTFCQRLEKTLRNLENVTIYTFITPVMNSTEMVKRIYCSPDPQQAWYDWILDQKEPPALSSSCKDTRGEKNAELFDKFGMEGLPTMYFSDGYRLEGAASLQEIEARLKAVKAR